MAAVPFRGFDDPTALVSRDAYFYVLPERSRSSPWRWRSVGPGTCSSRVPGSLGSVDLSRGLGLRVQGEAIHDIRGRQDGEISAPEAFPPL